MEATHQMSHAQVCKLVGCSRTKKYYQKRMPAKDAIVKKAIGEVNHERPHQSLNYQTPMAYAA
jgi:transposase InsO family protein